MGIVDRAMRIGLLCITLCVALCCVAQRAPKPMAVPPPAPLPEPRYQLFRGTIQLQVDATDTAHGIVHVTEFIPLQAAGDIVLLYPEWETTSHAPSVSAVGLAGVKTKIDGRDVEWRRDVADTHVFHLTAQPQSRTLTLSFEYLSPRASAEIRPQMIDVQWQHLLLYPAGWYVRAIPVSATLRLPAGLEPFTSLTRTANSRSSEGFFAFAPETLDRLVDAPVYAARYSHTEELSRSSSAAVHLDLVADAPDSLAISAEQMSALKSLVLQTGKVFGPAPFRITKCSCR